MRTFFNDLLAQLKGIWSRLDGGQRLVVAAVLCATLVGLGGIVWYAGRPSYETVFTPIGKDDITAAKRALEQASITYLYDGESFTVERSRAGAAHLAIKEAGLGARSDASLGAGSSIIDDAETKAWKLDNQSRLLAENAVRQLDGVMAVTITASRPRRVTAFRDRDRENRPSATAAIRLKPGAAFDAVAGHASALCASQLMIPRENIEVVNAAGTQRYRYDPDREAGGGSSEFLAMQRKMGEERTQQAQQLLDQLWPGKTSVAVTVELDARWEITSEKMLPEEQRIKSQKTSKDSTETGTAAREDTSNGSTLATGSQPPPASTGGAPKSNSKNETKDTEFVTEIGERRSGRLAPAVKRMTVAVLYDRSLEKSEGFTPDGLAKAVKATVGWDSARDSDESFSSMPGDFPVLDPVGEVSSGPGFVDLAMRWGPTVGQVLGVIVVVMFLRGLFRRTQQKAEPVVEIGRPAREAGVNPDEQQRQMRQEIERSIANDPAALAKLLETWLTEQKA